MEEILKKIYNYISKHAVDNETEYFLFHRNRYLKLLNIVNSFYSKNLNFLDIGSHFCHVLIGAKMMGFNSFGTDLDEFVSKTTKRAKDHNIKLKKCDLKKDAIPFDDNFFDLIFFSETLEHLNFHPQRAFNEASRVLKPGAKMIISTPNLLRLNNRIKLVLGKSINHDIKEEYTAGTHYREYCSKEIKYLLKASCLSPTKIKHVDFNYPDTKMLVKIFNILMGFINPKLKGNIIIIAQK